MESDKNKSEMRFLTSRFFTIRPVIVIASNLFSLYVYIMTVTVLVTMLIEKCFSFRLNQLL